MERSSNSGNDASRHSSPEGIPSGFRLRDDGALCYGDDCLIFKPEGKDLRITVDGSRCGSAALEAYGELLERTLGKGGKTIFETPARIQRDV